MTFPPPPGAMEERRKNEPVHCPVCRAIWPYHMSSPSANFVPGPEIMPVSVPVAAPGGVPARKPHISSGSSGNLILSVEKAELLEKLKQVGNGCDECLLSCNVVLESKLSWSYLHDGFTMVI